MYGDEVPRFSRVILDLLPEAGNVIVNGTGEGKIVISPVLVCPRWHLAHRKTESHCADEHATNDMFNECLLLLQLLQGASIPEGDASN